MWDLSRPDWAGRLAARQSLIPTLPLFDDQAQAGVAFFDELRLPDALPGDDGMPPRLGDVVGEWFREIVRVAFGSWDPVGMLRWIRDILLMAPKGQAKTTLGAALCLSIMLMNERRNCQGLFVGPTQSISDRAYEQAVGMIELDAALKKRFRTIDHEKTIIDRVLNAEMKVKTFDTNILTGAILIFALIDELHLLGRSPHTTKVLRQIRGGLDKTPEGLLLITTTQSDEEPAGAFKDELTHARKIRDGRFAGMEIRPMLPVLYEFPDDIGADPAKWQNPENWPMVVPNLGRSTHLRDMVPDWETERQKGEHSIRIWASQHLNIQIGVGIKSDHWPGARHWEKSADPALNSLVALLKKCEVAVVGIDGGGLDDLLGLTVIGREIGSRAWLSWSKAWAHESVFEQRRSEESRLRGFADDGDLAIVERLGDDIVELVGIIGIVTETGLLGFIGDRKAIGLDPVGIGQIIDALVDAEIIDNDEQVVGVTQGWKLAGAIKTTERKLADGSMRHAAQGLMDWCVGNAKQEPRGNAVLITKQVSGTGKIDPLMALFDAAALMTLNPETTRSVYEDRPLLVL